MDSDPQAIASPSDLSETKREQDSLKSMSAEEKKRKNIESAIEQQRSAERRKEINIAKMAEDIELANRKRAVNLQLAL